MLAWALDTHAKHAVPVKIVNPCKTPHSGCPLTPDLPRAEIWKGGNEGPTDYDNDAFRANIISNLMQRYQNKRLLQFRHSNSFRIFHFLANMHVPNAAKTCTD